jgi:hypothetical protein
MNIKEAKNVENDSMSWGMYKPTEDAEKIVAWIHELPEQLKELGFQKIRKLRKDHTYVQAQFKIEAAYGDTGPNERNQYEKIANEILSKENLFTTYLDDDELLDEWEKLDRDSKVETLIDNLKGWGSDFETAIKRYVRRHPGSLPEYLNKAHAHGDENRVEYANKLDLRNSSDALDLSFSGDGYRYVELVVNLERKRNKELFYCIRFAGDSWQGTTMKELEADWDDFLVNSFGNALGA